MLDIKHNRSTQSIQSFAAEHFERSNEQPDRLQRAQTHIAVDQNVPVGEFASYEAADWCLGIADYLRACQADRQARRA